MRAVEKADVEIARAADDWRNAPAVEALGWMSEIGDQLQMRLLCGGVIALGVVRSDDRLARAGFRMLAAHTVATWMKDFVKTRIDRTRPRQVVDGRGSHRVRRGDSHGKEETSFPSGHTAGALAAARAFAREYPEHEAAALGAAGAVALIQIPRCAHYPSDIGAGAAIGIAAEAAVGAGARAFWKALMARR